jgi:arsenate reductase
LEVPEKITMKNILVLCTGNSCRSQMAHGYLEQYVAGKAAVYSAGIETHGVNPMAIKIMADDGVDISQHTSDNVSKYLHIKFDLIITVCDNAQENCPYFPGDAQRLHCNFPDPSKFKGNEAETYMEFVRVRQLIKAFCKKIAADI